jgi:hypothetical protein
MRQKPNMGRPKSRWNPEKDVYASHARQAKVTEEVLRVVLSGVHGHQNPFIRLDVADAVLRLEPELRRVRQEAAQEMRKRQGRTWTEIGIVMGVSRQRAWQIGNGR